MSSYCLIYTRRYRLAGPNPVLIQKCNATTLSKLTALDTPEYSKLKHIVHGAFKRSELYVVDLNELKGVPAGEVSVAETISHNSCCYCLYCLYCSYTLTLLTSSTVLIHCSFTLAAHTLF
jgi:hypothetical protein